MCLTACLGDVHREYTVYMSAGSNVYVEMEPRSRLGSLAERPSEGPGGTV